MNKKTELSKTRLFQFVMYRITLRRHTCVKNKSKFPLTALRKVGLRWHDRKESRWDTLHCKTNRTYKDLRNW